MHLTLAYWSHFDGQDLIQIVVPDFLWVLEDVDYQDVGESLSLGDDCVFVTRQYSLPSLDLDQLGLLQVSFVLSVSYLAFLASSILHF